MHEGDNNFLKKATNKTHMMVDELYELIDIVKKVNKEAYDNIPSRFFDDMSFIDNITLIDYNMLTYYLNDALRTCKPIKCECDETCKDCDNQCHNCNENNKFGDFIDRLNESLPNNYKINKDEALKARKVYNNDVVRDLSKSKKIESRYSEVAKEANRELFDTDELISYMSLGDLKYLIYKNHWENEFDCSLINSRVDVLSFLYHKLEDRIAEKLAEDSNKEKHKEERYGNCDSDIYDSFYLLLKNILN